MPVVSPPTVTALPTPPSTASPSNFDARADAFLGALPVFQTQTDALAANVFANATDAATSATSASGSAATATTQAGLATANGAAQVALATTQATNAASSALLAASYAGAALWVSGATYSIGDVRYSAVTGRVYRRLTAGAGVTDPSADGTNWRAVDTGPMVVTVAGTTQTAVAGNHYLMTNVAASTLTLPPTPAAGDEVWVTFTNGLYTNNIARNGGTIFGDASDFLINAGVLLTWKFKYLNTDWKTV